MSDLLASDSEILAACGNDPIKAGRMKAALAEMTEAFAEVDRLAADKQRQGMRRAVEAIMAGKYAERDQICAGLLDLPKLTAAAKKEIGLRIGESVGLDRDKIEGIMARRGWAS